MVADAQGDQLLHRAGVDVAGDHGDDHRVAGRGAGLVSRQPRAAVPGGHRRGGAAGSPPRPVRPDPGVLQRRAGIQLAQLGEGDVDQGLDRLPGPAGQQAGGQQPAHRLLQRVMVTLRPGPQVPATRRGRQRIQHRLDHRRALRGQIPAQDTRPVKSGLERHTPVQVRVIGWVRRSGPVQDLRADRSQRLLIRPGPGRRHHDLLGRAAELHRDPPGPPGHPQRHRLGQHVPLGQRVRQHPMPPRQHLHRLMLSSLPPGHPGGMHQPRPRRPLPVSHVPVTGIERLQVPAPQRGLDRVDPFQHPQALSEHLIRQVGRVLAGQDAQQGLQHLQRLAGVGRDGCGAHGAGHLPGCVIMGGYLIRP